MYASIKEKQSLVINFPSLDVYNKCYSSVSHNQYEDDEIPMSGLTVEKASFVNAPRIKECFLNLECEYAWERELTPDSYHIVLCVKVVNVVMDEEHYNVAKKGRYGDTGYLYNIHSPLNPESGKEEDTYVGTINKYATYDELPK